MTSTGLTVPTINTSTPSITGSLSGSGGGNSAGTIVGSVGGNVNIPQGNSGVSYDAGFNRTGQILGSHHVDTYSGGVNYSSPSGWNVGVSGHGNTSGGWGVGLRGGWSF